MPEEIAVNKLAPEPSPKIQALAERAFALAQVAAERFGPSLEPVEDDTQPLRINRHRLVCDNPAIPEVVLGPSTPLANRWQILGAVLKDIALIHSETALASQPDTSIHLQQEADRQHTSIDKERRRLMEHAHNNAGAISHNLTSLVELGNASLLASGQPGYTLKDYMPQQAAGIDPLTVMRRSIDKTFFGLNPVGDRSKIYRAAQRVREGKPLYPKKEKK